MLTYNTANTKSDLEGILSLQKVNLSEALTKEEMQSQGFVTVSHSYAQLEKLNNVEKHLIAKSNGIVIGYVLAMTQQSKFDLPILRHMFDIFDDIIYNGKRVCDFNYVVVGQACIDKDYRGQGVIDNLYFNYKDYFSNRFDFAITGIASTNSRSLYVHRRVGFKKIHTYLDANNCEWVVVLWSWNSGKLP